MADSWSIHETAHETAIMSPMIYQVSDTSMFMDGVTERLLGGDRNTAAKMAQIFSGAFFAALVVYLIMSNSTRLSYIHRASLEKRLNVISQISTIVAAVSAFLNLFQITEVDNFVLPGNRSGTVDTARPLEWLLTCPLLQLCLVLMGGSRIPESRLFYMPMSSAAVLSLGTITLFLEEPWTFVVYGFALIIHLTAMYFNRKQIIERSNGEEGLLSGDSEFRKATLILMFTWLPFPAWYMLSPEGLGYFTDNLTIQLGWAGLNVTSKFTMIFYLQRIKDNYCNRLKVKREMKGALAGASAELEDDSDEEHPREKVNGELTSLVVETMNYLGMAENVERFLRLLQEARVCSLDDISSMTEAEAEAKQLPLDLIIALQRRQAVWKLEMVDEAEKCLEAAEAHYAADHAEKLGPKTALTKKVLEKPGTPTGSTASLPIVGADGKVHQPNALASHMGQFSSILPQQVNMYQGNNGMYGQMGSGMFDHQMGNNGMDMGSMNNGQYAQQMGGAPLGTMNDGQVAQQMGGQFPQTLIGNGQFNEQYQGPQTFPGAMPQQFGGQQNQQFPGQQPQANRNNSKGGFPDFSNMSGFPQQGLPQQQGFQQGQQYSMPYDMEEKLQKFEDKLNKLQKLDEKLEKFDKMPNFEKFESNLLKKIELVLSGVGEKIERDVTKKVEQSQDRFADRLGSGFHDIRASMERSQALVEAKIENTSEVQSKEQRRQHQEDMQAHLEQFAVRISQPLTDFQNDNKTNQKNFDTFKESLDKIQDAQKAVLGQLGASMSDLTDGWTEKIIQDSRANSFTLQAKLGAMEEMQKEKQHQFEEHFMNKMQRIVGESTESITQVMTQKTKSASDELKATIEDAKSANLSEHAKLDVKISGNLESVKSDIGKNNEHSYGAFTNSIRLQIEGLQGAIASKMDGKFETLPNRIQQATEGSLGKMSALLETKMRETSDLKNEVKNVVDNRLKECNSMMEARLKDSTEVCTKLEERMKNNMRDNMNKLDAKMKENMREQMELDAKMQETMREQMELLRENRYQYEQLSAYQFQGVKEMKEYVGDCAQSQHDAVSTIHARTMDCVDKLSALCDHCQLAGRGLHGSSSGTGRGGKSSSFDHNQMPPHSSPGQRRGTHDDIRR